jgi:hypothetical protein
MGTGAFVSCRFRAIKPGAGGFLAIAQAFSSASTMGVKQTMVDANVSVLDKRTMCSRANFGAQREHFSG